VALAEEFHNVLTMQLPSFPFGRDYLSVWKRTNFVDISDTDYTRSISSAKVDDDEEANCWSDIPVDEQISDFSTPAFQHLLYDELF
jgi:hypothetical protein